MNNRERAMNILHYRHSDRMPAVHFGYWPELVREWANDGYIPKEIADGWYDGGEADRQLDSIIGWDFNWYTCFGSNNILSPRFESKILDILPDGTVRQLTCDGIIQKLRPGVVSIPSEDDYLLKDRNAFDTLFKPKMQYFPERVNMDFYRNFNENIYDKSDRPLGIHVGSVLGEIRNFCSLAGMSYLMYDEDETLFSDIVDTYAELQYRCAEQILSTGAKFDFGHYWEDICFNSGPLISPKMFDEICRKHYIRRNELLHTHGIDIISLDCDGVTGALLDTWFETGVNVMFPIEIGTWGDQFEKARVKYGKGMLGVGGMDKTALRKDRKAVDEELERIKRLASLGGFIPCPDHRLMPGTKFELVKYYAEEVKKITY